MSLWRTDSDTFEHGQWIKGRVYERRSDVSADGSLFVAFVRQSGGRLLAPGAADSWVALSRPPYFTALAVWFVGGTYHTGGFFPDRSSLWVGFQQRAPDIGAVAPSLTITAPRSIAYIDRTNEWPDRTVHFNRLFRDGWRKLEDDTGRTVWQRSQPDRSGSLSMEHRFDGFQKYGGPYTVRYSVRSSADRAVDLGEATWADWDQQGRLVLAQKGRLLEWTETAGLSLLCDFNDHAPDPKPAPEAMKSWPE